MIKKTIVGELEASFQLCENRHDECPVTESIFPNTVAVMAFPKLELLVSMKLEPLVQEGLTRLIIYTSGCQSALVAVLNVAWKLKIREVVIMHKDNAIGGWQAQRVVTLNDLVA